MSFSFLFQVQRNPRELASLGLLNDGQLTEAAQNAVKEQVNWRRRKCLVFILHVLD